MALFLRSKNMDFKNVQRYITTDDWFIIPRKRNINSKGFTELFREIEDKKNRQFKIPFASKKIDKVKHERQDIIPQT